MIWTIWICYIIFILVVDSKAVYTLYINIIHAFIKHNYTSFWDKILLLVVVFFITCFLPILFTIKFFIRRLTKNVQ